MKNDFCFRTKLIMVLIFMDIIKSNNNGIIIIIIESKLKCVNLHSFKSYANVSVENDIAHSPYVI